MKCQKCSCFVTKNFQSNILDIYSDIKITHVSYVNIFPVNGWNLISSLVHNPIPNVKAPSIWPMSISGDNEEPVSSMISVLELNQPYLTFILMLVLNS